eukprot:PhM_4_TR15922/c0_g1_i1/m.11349
MMTSVLFLLLLVLFLTATTTTASTPNTIFHPTSFDFIGPFIFGKTEYDGDPLAFAGGPLEAFKTHRHQNKMKNNNNNKKSTPKTKIISENAEPQSGGKIKWKTVPASSSEWVVQFPHLGQELVPTLGTLAAVEFVAYGFFVFTVPFDGTATFHVTVVPVFFID